MNRNDLQSLSDLRVQEAKALLDGGYYDGAYYLLGYAWECALKSCIAKQFKKHDFPDKRLVLDSYTHELEKLLRISGLREKLESAMKRNPGMQLNWGIVKDWSEKSRYDFGKTEVELSDFFQAVTEEKTGILSWLKKWW